MWEDVHNLYADCTQFYISDLNLCRFCYLWWGQRGTLGYQIRLCIIVSKYFLQVLFFLRNFLC